MSRKLKILLAIIIIFIAVIIIVMCRRVNIDGIDSCHVRFVYNDKDIYEEVSQDDMNQIYEIIEGKILYKDSPSCGFSDEISFSFNQGEQIFCIACDTCPKVYWANKGRYFNLTDEENWELREILKKYGFEFPCI